MRVEAGMALEVAELGQAASPGTPHPGLGARTEPGAQQGGRLLTRDTAVSAGHGALPRGLVHTPDASLRRLQPGKLSCLGQSQGRVTLGKVLALPPGR